VGTASQDEPPAQASQVLISELRAESAAHRRLGHFGRKEQDSAGLAHLHLEEVLARRDTEGEVRREHCLGHLAGANE
jgi:hypothetical protein